MMLDAEYGSESSICQKASACGDHSLENVVLEGFVVKLPEVLLLMEPESSLEELLW